MERRQTFSIWFVFCALLLVALVSFQHAGAAEEQSGEQAPSARSKFQLPKLFDFQRFKQLFKKSYSYLEDLARNKIFLGRAFRVFLSAIAYKHRKQSFYLAVNQFSDWTPSEVDSMYMRTEEVTIQPNAPELGGEVEEKQEPHSDVEPAIFPVASEEEIEKTLVELSEKHGDIQAAISEELNHSGSRRKRNIDAGNLPTRELDFERDLIKKPQMATNEKLDRVESNNPNYEEPELMSFGFAEDELRRKMKMNEKKAAAINKQPGTDYISMLVDGLGGIWNQAKPIIKEHTGYNFEQEKQNVEPHATAPPVVWPPNGNKQQPPVWLAPAPKPDEVFVDLRETAPHCYLAPRSQGRCGSCYSFATIALYEWHFCRETGKRVAFSEQYIVDCGKAVGLNGCSGGVFTKVSDFIRNFGLEMRVNYPYRERDDQCPYHDSEKSPKMGYIRMSDYGFQGIGMDYVERFLKQEPMVINIYTSDEFSYYGGGVHMASETCNENRAHSVLLIGSGREDGEEYWLMRNSHSVSWGEAGHYKMNKKAIKCIDTKSAYKLLKPQVTKLNSASVSDQVKRRYKEYVASPK